MEAVWITGRSFAFRASKDTTPEALIFDSLLKWKDTCAVCDEAISTSDMKESDKMSVSIGLKDPRIGNRITRSMVSDNRKDVYKCLAEMTLAIDGTYFWNDTQGLLVHYYAKLYHRGCKWFREKETALA